MFQFLPRTKGFASPICHHVFLSHGKSETRIKNKDNWAITGSQEENRGPEFICKSALEVDFP